MRLCVLGDFESGWPCPDRRGLENGGKDYIFLIEFGRYIVVVVVESDEYAS